MNAIMNKWMLQDDDMNIGKTIKRLKMNNIMKINEIIS